ncbi:hypothetical protein ENSA5_03310 [Enhygromyxa salina]|uniref:Uncharacterized protein n=1 Tax=Enhygromyxa salina TaxID=215803 RepID=A0A2S9YJT4_9BACT|nr:hypothetical protein ENSA5_03310 [Enhygromyxa salina]
MLAPALLLASPTTSAAQSEAEVPAAYVKVALTLDGSTFEHPGFLMASDEEGVFVIEHSDKAHEIKVSFRELGESSSTVLVEYAIGGRTQWLEELEVAAARDTELSKGKSKLTINVDPQGSKDSSRDDEDKVEGPDHDEDDPLGGLLK